MSEIKRVGQTSMTLTTLNRNNLTLPSLKRLNTVLQQIPRQSIKYFTEYYCLSQYSLVMVLPSSQIWLQVLIDTLESTRYFHYISSHLMH